MISIPHPLILPVFAASAFLPAPIQMAYLLACSLWRTRLKKVSCSTQHGWSSSCTNRLRGQMANRLLLLSLLLGLLGLVTGCAEEEPRLNLKKKGREVPGFRA